MMNLLRIMRKYGIALVASLFVLVFSACLHSNKNKPTHRNNEVTKIVSLTPSITKQLILLGVQHQVVGHTSYCPPEDLPNSQLVASATEVNVEKIALLDPDMVLVSTLTKEKVVKNLRKLGIEVYYLHMPASYKEIRAQFIQIGQMVQKADKARRIMQRQENRLDSLQKLIPKNKRPRIFIEIGANPLFGATSRSFMHDYINYANGVNILEDVKSGMVSRESVLVKNPDAILIVTMGIVGQEEKEIWQEYPNLSANKKDQIFILDADESSSPTPISFTMVVEKIIHLLYLEDKQKKAS